MRIYKLKEVFVPGGQPTITYVDRDHLGLERDLRRALAKGYSIIAITGSTKSGKTVLCRKVIPDPQSVWIEGGQVKSLDNIATQIAFKLNVPDNVSRDQSQETSAGVGIAIPGITANLGGKDGSKQTLSWSGPALVKAYEALRRQDKTLIIDDFHYVPMEVQQDFVRSIKSEVFNGLGVVLISVPHRAFDVVRVENEMQGRFSHIRVGQWSNADLEKIVALGADALNVRFPRPFIEFAIRECVGNPLIMQSICSEICAENDVCETESGTKDIHFDAPIGEGIMINIAKDAGYPTFRKLQAGPQIRKSRQVHEFADSEEEGDIYKSVLHAISKTGPKQRLTYNEIREELQSLLKGKIPQKHEVTRTLAHMGKLAKEQEGEPAIDWMAEDETLYITDPFLLCFMRWLPKIDPDTLQ